MADEGDVDVEENREVKSAVKPSRPTRKANKSATLKQIILKNEKNALVRRVSNILRKAHGERTKEDVDVLTSSPELADRLKKQAIKRDAVKLRTQEIEDPADIMEQKCQKLAAAIGNSTEVVVYTGAGISTAASIPDYRGPNGVWTLLQKGQQPEAQDLSDAEPTFTHMCITKLYKEGHVKYVVSQNCDGLHVRSGLPRNVLSEVHGNMYLEICTNCKPQRDYIRLFDVTEKTGVRRHYTDRNCHMCGKKLRDTIVHFGEKGGLKSPYRWKQAARAANNCDIILCLGTSLKILKKYSCLWCMDRRLKQRPDLYIVNLQWTPKDEVATLKINGRCDAVLKRVMEILRIPIPVYRREEDAIFTMAVSLKLSEYKTTSKKILATPKHFRKRKRKKVSSNDYDQYEEKKPTVRLSTDDGSHIKSEGINSHDDEQRNGIHRGLNGLSFTQTSLSTPHIPLQTSPLDLSVSNQSQLSSNFARNWSHDLFSVFLANQNLLLASQQQLDICTTCLANRRLGQQCTCVNSGLSLPAGLMAPDINSLLSYQSMQLMRNMFLGNSSMHLPFPGFLPYASSSSSSSLSSVFQPPQRVETVLRDHCYLNKQQMQQLSPKQNKDVSKSSKLCNDSGQSQKVKVETATSPLKPCSSYIKDSDLTLDTDNNTQKIRTMCKLERSISQDDRPPEVLPQSKSEVESIETETNETEPENSVSKKPKLTRSASVPGWFGKGLNIRKKKRF